MSPFLTGVLTILLPTLQTIETGAVVDLLEKMFEHSADDHKATCQSIYPGLLRLKVFAEQSKTKFDNIAVDGLIAAVEQSAAAHDVTLPA